MARFKATAVACQPQESSPGENAEGTASDVDLWQNDDKQQDEAVTHSNDMVTHSNDTTDIVESKRYVSTLLKTMAYRFMPQFIIDYNIQSHDMSNNSFKMISTNMNEKVQLILQAVDKKADLLALHGIAMVNRLSPLMQSNVSLAALPPLAMLLNHLTSPDNKLKTVSDVQMMIAKRWNVTATWVDEKFDIYLEVSEKYIDNHLHHPNGVEKKTDQITKTQRVLAISRKVKDHLGVHLFEMSSNLQSNTKQMIGSLANRALNILVAPKSDNPSSVADSPDTKFRGLFGGSEALMNYKPIAERLFKFRKIVVLELKQKGSYHATALSLSSMFVGELNSAFRNPNLMDNLHRALQKTVSMTVNALPVSRRTTVSKHYFQMLYLARTVIGEERSSRLADLFCNVIVIQSLHEQLKGFEDDLSTSTTSTALNSSAPEWQAASKTSTAATSPERNSLHIGEQKNEVSVEQNNEVTTPQAATC